MSSADAEAFEKKVDEISSQINGLIQRHAVDLGQVTVDDVDRKIQHLHNADSVKVREAAEKAEALRKYGRPGKGNSEGYVLFCKKCFTEYVGEVESCGRCGNKKLMARKERLEELHAKVENLQKENAAHAWRKDKWERWLKSRQLVPKSKVINYQKWEYWEPKTDTEEEGNHGVAWEWCKDRGNALLKSGDFVGAIEEYESGLEFQRDNKALWTNKALAELKLGRFEQAADSCSKVLEMVEIFEDGYSQSADACTKALLRRSMAFQNLRRWDAAKCDAEEALKLGVAPEEAQSAIDLCDRHLREIKSTRVKEGDGKPSQDPLKKATSETIASFLLEDGRPPLGKISDLDESAILAALSIDAESLRKVVHCGGLDNLLDDLSRAALLHRNASIEDPDELRSIGLLRCLRLLVRICELSDTACEVFSGKAGAHIGRLVQLIKSKIRCGRCVALMAELSTRPGPRRQLQEALSRDKNSEVLDTIVRRVACRKRSSSLASMCVLANCATSCQGLRCYLQSHAELCRCLPKKVADAATAEQAAGVICNVGGEAVASSCALPLLEACKKQVDEKSTMAVLGALQNCCTVSTQAAQHVAEQGQAEAILCDVARRQPRTVGRVLTILLRLAQLVKGGVQLGNDSESVVLAEGILSDATDPSLCDPALRLLCHAVKQDTSCLTPGLVRAATELLLKFPPQGYDDRDKTLYMLRGNACLVIAAAADLTRAGSKQYEGDLVRAVVPMLECLRKQDQANAGSALAKCSMASEKAKEVLREQGGLDTLWKMQSKLLKTPGAGMGRP
ncbi:hypothetical protein FOZ60_003261 [Perkinsus olseni]|uniref:Protein unc-45 homolog B n=1 Tax=Perkinsus olseni TaxID=32597 RepID=A0A7J6NY67_PEROL|nr:hypothetical protein FOZ60_003261 [Perkinsus olseni]